MVVLAFWIASLAIGYSYFGYPLVVALLARRRPPASDRPMSSAPHVTMLVPVHNERATIEAKLANTRALDYPEGHLTVLFVSDGSSDGTVPLIDAACDERIQLLELAERGGKAKALNAGLERAQGEIVVFSDASIRLEANALAAIVHPFADPSIGCVSGEDRIEGGGGEGLYGRYEMFLRRQESRLHSIVGASGSFYAQRRELCEPFVPNLAPDFLSVLRTVDHGQRAISEPLAIGYMRAVDDPRHEFDRKVRTILRGITTLGRYRHLLNPLRTGIFAFELWSHKLIRWLVPAFMIVTLLTSAWLARSSTFYLAAFVLQVAFHALAITGLRQWHLPALGVPTRIAVYLTTANAATLVAWTKYLAGHRQELWAPSKR